MRRLPLLLALWPGWAAADWQFSAPIAITAPQAPAPHLDAAGRRSIASSDDTVAVVWEQEGRVLAAVRSGETSFAAATVLSDGPDAFAPAVTATPGGRFVALWEQEGRLRGRGFGAQGLGPAAWIDAGAAQQPTLDRAPDGSARAAWIRREGRSGRVVSARIALGQDGAPAVEKVHPIEAGTSEREQLYPAIAALPERTVVAWEDRREGHTRILFATAGGDGVFGTPHLLNELPESQGSSPFGRGSGVTRVALAQRGENVFAVWMDKRDYRGGYDIYGALSTDGGRAFGPNELVQDAFGENHPQWHPAVALAPDGTVTTLWDDPRDGTPDLWLATREGPARWSENLAVPGASGPGDQDNPVVAFDGAGQLHLAWVERIDGKGRLLYSVGKR